jgi:dienelactone hydrolase
LRDWYRANPPALAFNATSRDEAMTWQERLRGMLTALLGLDRLRQQEGRWPVEAEAVGSFDEEAYLGERVLVRTQADMWVPAWVLVPTHKAPPHPAVMCFHGHGMSKDVTIGRPSSQAEREALERYKGDYGRRFAEAGYLCFCPDTRGFGERDSARGCSQICLNALSVGYTLGGLRIWDHLRCLDYLVSRPDVDAKRIGAVGLSMGCEHTMYVSALDNRVAVAVLSCCMFRLRERIDQEVYCPCSYIPSLFSWLDWPDIGCAIAPRPVLIQQGIRDTYPMVLVEAAVAQMQQAYAVFGSPEHIDADYFEGAHEFHFQTALSWIERWIGR